MSIDILYHNHQRYKIELYRNRLGDCVFEIIDDDEKKYLTIQLSENQLKYLKERCNQLLDE